MLQALVDNGCLCSAIINADVSKKLKLPRIPIIPRKLQTAEMSTESKLEVDSITHITLDLEGCYGAHSKTVVAQKKCYKRFYIFLWTSTLGD